MWRRKVVDNATNQEEESLNSDRPVVPLVVAERPIATMTTEYYPGQESKIIQNVSSHDPESGLDPLLPSTLLSMCLLHAHLIFKGDEGRKFLADIKAALKIKEAELVGMVEKFKNDAIESEQNGSQKNTAGAIGLMMARIPLMFQICYWASNAAEIAIFWKRGIDQNESEITSLYAISQRFNKKFPNR
jgi:hypothetical protein